VPAAFDPVPKRCDVARGLRALRPPHRRLPFPALARHPLVLRIVLQHIANGFDADPHLGEALEQNMIDVRVSPNLQMVLVTAPAYLARHARAPAHPRTRAPARLGAAPLHQLPPGGEHVVCVGI
jgi:hypothetical protein